MAERDRRNASAENMETSAGRDKGKGLSGGLLAVIIGLIVLALIVWIAFSLFDTAEDATPNPNTQDNIETDIDTGL